jgi:hypothetical protein
LCLWWRFGVEKGGNDDCDETYDESDAASLHALRMLAADGRQYSGDQGNKPNEHQHECDEAN